MTRVAPLAQRPIVLLYPPVSDPSQPYTSLPALTAWLRRSGFRVVQRDLGIEILDELLTASSLASAYGAACRLAASSDTLACDRNDFLRRFYSIADLSPFVTAHVDSAKEVMRDCKQFYDLRRYQWARNILEMACDLVSLPHHPTKLSLTDYESPVDLSFNEILSATARAYDNVFLEPFRKRLDSILAIRPLLVGISITYQFQVLPGLTLARLLKHADPTTHVTIGGAIIHRLASALMENVGWFEFADTYVVGEGETALLGIANALADAGAVCDGVPNVVTKVQSQVQVASLTWCEAVARLPSPDFDGLPITRYLSPEPVLLVSTTRGCYHGKCAFCDVSRNTRSSYRPASAEKVIGILCELNRKYNARHFFFCDDAMPLSNMRRIARFIKQSGVDFIWQAETRLETALTTDVLRLLALGGCRQLIFGMESRSQRVLNLMGKQNSVENDDRVLESCFEAGIAVTMQSFVGFPTETAAEARATVDALLRNETLIASIGFGVFTLFENTPIHKNPEKFLLRQVSRSKKDAAFGGCDYVASVGMSQDDARRFYRQAMKEIGPVYGSRPYMVYATHSLLQLGRRSWPELHEAWQELQAPLFSESFCPETLRVIISPTLMLAPRDPKVNATVHRAFCGASGKDFELSPSQRRILDLCSDRTVSEAIALWSEDESERQDANEIQVLARGLSHVYEFLRLGLVRPTMGQQPPLEHFTHGLNRSGIPEIGETLMPDLGLGSS